MIVVAAVEDARSLRAAQDLLLRFAEEASWFGRPVDIREEATWAQELYAPPEGGLWVAWRAGEAVGLAALGAASGPPGRTAELRRLYVARAARGAGVGEALARAALETARAAGYGDVVAEVLPGMEPLFGHLGFVRVPPWRDLHPKATPMALRLR